jgi:four helix bundle protein
MRFSIHGSSFPERNRIGEGCERMMSEDDFEELPAWKAARALVQEIYRVTDGKPLEESASVAGQLRGIAITVPSKIAAGVGSGDPRLLVHNLSLAYGAIGELRTLCYVAHDMGELDAEVAERLATEAAQIGKLITRMTDNLPAAHPAPNGHSDDGRDFDD